jgi:hypothetical protein
MVSDVITPPVGVNAGVAGWVTVDRDPDSRTLDLPDLALVPPVRLAVEQMETPVGIWDVLTAWRAAERELAGITLESPDWPRVHADLVGLRAAYHRLFNERLSSTHQVLRVASTTLIVWR